MNSNTPPDFDFRPEPETFAGEPEQPYDGGGWPGDGSGTDDFADYNANEAADYGND